MPRPARAQALALVLAVVWLGYGCGRDAPSECRSADEYLGRTEAAARELAARERRTLRVFRADNEIGTADLRGDRVNVRIDENGVVKSASRC